MSKGIYPKNMHEHLKATELLPLVTGLPEKNVEILPAKKILIAGEVDASGLYSLCVIRSLSGDDEIFVEKMARMFVEQVPVQVTTMEEKYLMGDFKGMGLMAHSIKPVIDNMSIQSLKELIREVEKKGKEEVNDVSLHEVILHIKNTIHLVAADLKNIFPE